MRRGLELKKCSSFCRVEKRILTWMCGSRTKQEQLSSAFHQLLNEYLWRKNGGKRFAFPPYIEFG